MMASTVYENGIDRLRKGNQHRRTVIASSRKLNMCRNFIALGGQTHSQVSSHVHASRKKKKNTFQGYISCISSANTLLKVRMDVTQLALTWVRWPNGKKSVRGFARKFDLNQSERKTSQFKTRVANKQQRSTLKFHIFFF